MGSKEEDVPVEPVEKTIFAEDLSESELANAVFNIIFLINSLSYFIISF